MSLGLYFHLFVFFSKSYQKYDNFDAESKSEYQKHKEKIDANVLEAKVKIEKKIDEYFHACYVDGTAPCEYSLYDSNHLSWMNILDKRFDDNQEFDELRKRAKNTFEGRKYNNDGLKTKDRYLVMGMHRVIDGLFKTYKDNKKQEKLAQKKTYIEVKKQEFTEQKSNQASEKSNSKQGFIRRTYKAAVTLVLRVSARI